MEKTYQMLWDCTYCGQKKLLGLSHRFCPGCGAPQNAALRYYPSDAEKVAVEDHRYAGADVQCPSCQHYNSRAANHCGSCGGPLQGGKAVVTREAQYVSSGMPFHGEKAPPRQGVTGFPAPPALPARAGSSRTGCVVGLVVVVLAAIVYALFSWQKDGSYLVTGHTWERTVAIETFGPVREKAWCDEVPAGASVKYRTPEKRSTRDVADGQDCRTVRKDMGDGTYKESQQCTTRYKQEPVYADRCEYEIDKWTESRSVVTRGASVKDTLRWPDPGHLREGSCVGCERVGPSDQTYRVLFRDLEGKERVCVFGHPDSWVVFEVGARWKGKQSVLTEKIDCGTLKKE